MSNILNIKLINSLAKFILFNGIQLCYILILIKWFSYSDK